VCTILAPQFGGWFPAVGLLSVCLLLILGNLAKFAGRNPDPGLTTEMAALVMFGVGCMLGVGYVNEAIALGGVIAVLLHWKRELHAVVQRIGEGDFRAIIHLVLVALVILPVLPNRAFDPYGVLNPFKIWMIVVLIVGINLVAYVTYKIVAARTGSLLGGILGGFISSTATTVSYARQANANPKLVDLAAFVILLASTVVNVRVLFEIAVVAPSLLADAGPPILLMLLFMIALSVVYYFRLGHDSAAPTAHENPAQVRAALAFAALYSVVLFVVAAVESRFGSQALYPVAVVSGLTDVDAITLSTAELVKSDHLLGTIGWRVILLAMLSNLFFKAAAAGVIGGWSLLRRVAILFGLCIGCGLLLLMFWPDRSADLPWLGSFVGRAA
jgi:uncharacterized membrane protein (DUF4010 family)